MTKKSCKIQFIESKYSSIELTIDQKLAEHLTVENSPILFGCRTGICGTCIVAVEGNIPPPSSEEKELLEVLAPENPKARLACQIQLTNDIQITKIK
ncbi:2Fe-2S iron-sulfur cluster binding domain-containing protein [Calothrix sp. CCY 0018]|uniref:2Fe-2S iron-sulfur cluster binding domain-containing protein n=1 Tax=Calothrix sp. CCY 0018 TaxID=3103864 RepID=UPI0039C5C5C5